MAKLTPEQARDLVEHFGTQAAAARTIGVSRSTVGSWLYPERHAATYRRYRLRDIEAAREREAKRQRDRYWRMTSVERIEKELKNRRIKALQRKAKRHQRKATK